MMQDRRHLGPLEWMASNRVAANLLMLFFMVGGLLFANSVRQEVFPNVQLDMVSISVAYPGAGPREVEQGIVLAVEEATRGIEGVKEVRATAREGLALVNVELFAAADAAQVLDDIKSEVDRITSFPEDAEEPTIALAASQTQVLSLVIHGDVSRELLNTLSENIRSDLLQLENITLVQVAGMPPPEISIEVPQQESRRYQLTLGQIAQRVGNASLDLPSGDLETASGDLLLRVTERRDVGLEFEDIAILANPDGSYLTLGEIATVRDGFRDTDQLALYNGQPAVRVRVFRVGEQTPLEIAEAVKRYVQETRSDWPASVQLAIVDDMSEIFSNRVGLLMDNGQIGIVLVMVILGFFLQPRLAFWVTLGIPISFLGAFIIMPVVDVSINMISLFAFLLVLGIVVDDAIVVGEATFYQRSQGKRPLEAAIDGAREVVQPVVFAVCTTVLAFIPLLFVPGVTGQFFSNIPLIVIPILLISLVESLFILPAHLSHIPHRIEERNSRWFGWLTRRQRRFSGWVERQVDARYQPALEQLLHYRYLTMAIALAILLVTAGCFMSGRIAFHFFPDIEGDTVVAAIEFPFGTPPQETGLAIERLTQTAQTLGRDLAQTEGGSGGNGTSAGNNEDLGIVKGIYAEVGRAGLGDLVQSTSFQGGHMGFVQVVLIPAAERATGAAEFNRKWRAAVGTIAGTERLAFNYGTGPDTGQPVSIELAHEDRSILRQAADDLAARLADYAGVRDIDDGFQTGKPQLDITLKPAARALGVSEQDLARQLRAAYFGVEAKRQQRGRDELRIYVRRPQSERDSAWHVEQFVVQTRSGGEIPLHQAAHVRLGTSYTEIEREGGRRTVEVTADVDSQVTSGGKITSALETQVLPELLRRHEGLSYEKSGEQQDRAESIAALKRGMLLALLGMYTLVAVAFKSYVQPLIILFSIPFGLVGATIGHVLLGFNFSIISVFGLVALTGVVVNDSLVLIAAVNGFRAAGKSATEAIVAGARRRFRPVLLTSLTTFFGLAPMIFETSLQARFLIPMAISLGFGVLFVTLIALVMVPCSYRIVEDLKLRCGATRDRPDERL